MRLTRLTTLAVVAATAFTAGAWAQGAAGRAELDRVIQEQLSATNAKDWARLEPTWTEDAVKLEEGFPMIRGRAAVMKHFQGGPVGHGPMQAATIDAGTSGDLGFATYSGSHMDAKGGKQVWHGLSVFKRVDGQWKVAVDASLNDKK